MVRRRREKRLVIAICAAVASLLSFFLPWRICTGDASSLLALAPLTELILFQNVLSEFILLPRFHVPWREE